MSNDISDCMDKVFGPETEQGKVRMLIIYADTLCSTRSSNGTNVTLLGSASPDCEGSYADSSCLTSELSRWTYHHFRERTSRTRQSPDGVSSRP